MPKSAAALAEPLHQHILFAAKFVELKGNVTQAAIAAGYSPKSAAVTGSRLLKNAKVQAEIARLSAKIAGKAEISIENTLRENACIAHLDPRRLYRDDGSMLPPAEWPDDIAAAIASVETKETTGEDGKSIVTYKVKFWDKGAALDRLFKYQKLYADLPQSNTTNILNINVGVLDSDQRAHLRGLLAATLPGPSEGDTEGD